MNALAPIIAMLLFAQDPGSAAAPSASIAPCIVVSGGMALGWSVDPSSLVALYPPGEREKGTKGQATLNCEAAPDGTLRKCVVSQEQPNATGFGAASLEAATRLVAKVPQSHLDRVNNHLCLTMIWTPDAVTLRTTSIITSPNWVTHPTSQDLARAYPRKARRQGITGHTKIECVVDDRGSLEQCQVIEEDPPGWGFGDAALKLKVHILMRPRTVDGKPVGGAKVVIPMSWNLSP
jgi:TonB family protein